MLQLALCDDDPLCLSGLRAQFEQCAAALSCALSLHGYTNPEALLADLEQFDALFLDIDMPRLSGIDLAEAVRKQNRDLPIFFITNREDLVFQTFRLRTLGFLRKSHLTEELPEAIRVLQKELFLLRRTCSLKTKAGILQPRIREILYFESLGHDVFVHLPGQEPVKVQTTLERLEAELHPAGFLRIHSGYLVNYLAIFSIDKTSVLLDHGLRLPLSRYRAARVKQEFHQFSRY